MQHLTHADVFACMDRGAPLAEIMACLLEALQQRDPATLAALAAERARIADYVARVEQERNEHLDILDLAIGGSGTGVWDRDVQAGTIRYSPGWTAILGYGAGELPTQIEDSYGRIHPDDLPKVRAAMQAHFEQRTPDYTVEHRIRCKDGSYKWIASRGKVVRRDAQGKALRMVGTTTDLSALRVLSEQLQQHVDLITHLTNQVPGLVYQYRLSPQGLAAVTYASAGIRELYELTPEQVTQDPSLIERAIHPSDRAGYRASLAESAERLTPWHCEYRVRLPTQGVRWRLADARPSRLQDGSTVWHGFVTDITERKEAERQLRLLASVDDLTQLPNQRSFMARMEQELARLRRSPQARATVLMCDLDHFKRINDGYGHARGDLVLQHFAAILRSQLRKDDGVGRVGGEEFAVVLPGACPAEALLFASRVQKRTLDTPWVDGGIRIALTVSIGIATMLADDADIAASLSRSDKALYRAKRAGRNRIELGVS
ncbi:sensor domain-containing diguanylate cyclase [Thiomonas sp. X19]|uniref:sensor domain-containing diguanylate cyclase n=1 Tax=Thiomonas sp. X19 TaxID=1050370 RepID=UPI001E3B09C7|nr:sensor domain-containing diguanylate cyclase [Thiomonas sp. X19]